jgi:hypothetical protein
MMLRPYWLDRLRVYRRSITRCRAATVSFVGRRGVWSGLAERFNVRVARRIGLACRRTRSSCEAPLALPVRRCCSSPRFPDAAAGPSNASHEVLSPTAHTGCVALFRGGQPSGTVPLRRLPRQPVCRRESSVRFLMLRGLWRPARIGAVRRGRPGAGHASQVPCKRCSATRTRRALSQPGCHHCSSAHGVVPFAVLILAHGWPLRFRWPDPPAVS